MVVTDTQSSAVSVALVERNQVIEQVSAAASDETFCHAILPWAAEAGPLRFDAKVLDRGHDFVAEVGSAVEDQVSRCVVELKGLSQWLRYPCIRRMHRHIAVEDARAVM
jgi:hypothetical protein